MWLGNDKNPKEWGWKRTSRRLRQIMNKLEPAPPSLLKLISCTCRTNCGTACGCHKAGLKCSTISKLFYGESCTNVKAVHVEEEDDDNDVYNFPTISIGKTN